MTPKTKVVLRTAFKDVFQVGDVVITQFGTEVEKAKADELFKVARRNGVTLVEVEDLAHVEEFVPTADELEALAATIEAPAPTPATKTTKTEGGNG